MTELKPLAVKPLKYQSLDGLSSKQLSEHHDVLYAGYVKKYNEITAALAEVDLTTANATFSDLRELKVEQSFALNAVKLHEAYFDNLTDKPKPADGQIVKAIESRWGSYQAWVDEFAALGLASRGWVALVFDKTLDRFENYIFDVHNQGGVADTKLILVLDVYEHAYFLDYVTGRKAYIEKFMALIDWDEVNSRLNFPAK